MPADIGEFIIYKFGLSGVQATSWLCLDCHHVFTTPFLDEDGLRKYYSNYMTPEFCLERVNHEPWFAPYVEERMNGEYDRMRRAHYDRTVDFAQDFAGKFVVDFGGGDGRLAREIFPASRVEVMDVTTPAADLERADLLFAAQVFEHIPHPLDTLKGLTEKLKAGASVYIEVPIDYNRSIVEDFYACQKFHLETGKRLDHALTLLHEHLTHFSKRSLRTLFVKCNIDPEEFNFTPNIFSAMGRYRP